MSCEERRLPQMWVLDKVKMRDVLGTSMHVLITAMILVVEEM